MGPKKTTTSQKWKSAKPKPSAKPSTGGTEVPPMPLEPGRRPFVPPIVTHRQQIIRRQGQEQNIERFLDFLKQPENNLIGIDEIHRLIVAIPPGTNREHGVTQDNKRILELIAYLAYGGTDELYQFIDEYKAQPSNLQVFWDNWSKIPSNSAKIDRNRRQYDAFEQFSNRTGDDDPRGGSRGGGGGGGGRASYGDDDMGDLPDDSGDVLDDDVGDDDLLDDRGDYGAGGIGRPKEDDDYLDPEDAAQLADILATHSIPKEDEPVDTFGPIPEQFKIGALVRINLSSGGSGIMRMNGEVSAINNRRGTINVQVMTPEGEMTFKDIIPQDPRVLSISNRPNTAVLIHTATKSLLPPAMDIAEPKEALRTQAKKSVKQINDFLYIREQERKCIEEYLTIPREDKQVSGIYIAPVDDPGDESYDEDFDKLIYYIKDGEPVLYAPNGKEYFPVNNSYYSLVCNPLQRKRNTQDGYTFRSVNNVGKILEMEILFVCEDGIMFRQDEKIYGEEKQWYKDNITEKFKTYLDQFDKEVNETAISTAKHIINQTMLSHDIGDDYDYLREEYIKKIVEELKKFTMPDFKPNSIKLFAYGLGNLIVYINYPKAKAFREKINNQFYTAHDLVFADELEKLPKADIDDYRIIQRRKENFLYYFIREYHKILHPPKEGLRSLFDPISLKQNCINKEDVKNIASNDLVLYLDPSTNNLYCIPIDYVISELKKVPPLPIPVPIETYGFNTEDDLNYYHETLLLALRRIIRLEKSTLPTIQELGLDSDDEYNSDADDAGNEVQSWSYQTAKRLKREFKNVLEEGLEVKVLTREIIAFVARYFKIDTSTQTLLQQYTQIMEKLEIRPANIEVRTRTPPPVEPPEPVVLNKYNKAAAGAQPFDSEWIEKFKEKFAERIEEYILPVEVPVVDLDVEPNSPSSSSEYSDTGAAPPVSGLIANLFSNLRIAAPPAAAPAPAPTPAAPETGDVEGVPEAKSSFSSGEGDGDTESESDSDSEVSVKDIHMIFEEGNHNFEAKEECAKCGKPCKPGDDGVIRSMLLEKDNFTATLWCCTKCCEDYDLDDDGRKAKRRQDQ